MKTFAKTLMAAVLGGVITLGSYKMVEEDKPQVVFEKASDDIAKTVGYEEGIKELNLDFSTTAEAVTPAVVHIRAEVQRQAQGAQQEVPDWFREFFGDPRGGDRFERRGPQQRPQMASGSGVIIGKEGHIVTNNHVIANATRITVALNDKRTYEASVIGTDPTTDLALIKIEESDLPTVALANSDKVRIGQWVMAVGNPFNLESTVTAGIVSAKGRNINILRDSLAIESFIQTDAAVNPGNSGGALVDLNGQLVGINTAIASPTGSYSGYSFAVPSNIVSKVVEDLINYGEVQRGLLGVMIRDLNGDLAEEQGIDLTEGVYIADVNLGSGAEESGLKAGDVIIAIDGKEIKSAPELQESIGRKRPGDVVKVTVNRDNKVKTFDVTLKSKKGTTEVVKTKRSAVARELGADFGNLSDEELDEYGLDHGIQVQKLFPGKLRSQTNMREGFIITKVNKSKVSSVNEFFELVEKEDDGILIEGYYPGSRSKQYYGFGK